MLDKTLTWFAVDPDELGIGEQGMSRAGVTQRDALRLIVQRIKELDSSEYFLMFPLIIRKLIKDGYIFEDDGLFKISFEGKLFFEKGGYVRKSLKETTLKVLQSVQTWAIVAGTVLAGIGAVYIIYRDALCGC